MQGLIEQKKKKMMKVEIWSDFMCPFCYIGKRQLEKGLDAFAQKEQVEIKWRSFQLDPGMQYEPGKTIHQVLAEKKGITTDQAKQLNDRVSNAAKDVGLEFNLDKAMPANTFRANRLSHLAAEFNLQDQMEERLFRAYFTEGKNIGDISTLLELAIEIGLPENDTRKALETNSYSTEVGKDIEQARQIGIRGVPFFLIDNKYAISGARAADLFTKAFSTAWKENEEENTYADTTSCTVDRTC